MRFVMGGRCRLLTRPKSSHRETILHQMERITQSMCLSSSDDSYSGLSVSTTSGMRGCRQEHRGRNREKSFHNHRLTRSLYILYSSPNFSSSTRSSCRICWLVSSTMKSGSMASGVRLPR